MHDRRRLLLLLALSAGAVALAPLADAADGADPRAVVAELYDLHRSRSPDAPPLWQDAALRDRLFSADLLAAFDALAAWQADNPDTVPPLDGDPFWDAQDWEISDLSVGPADLLGDGVAAVEVTFLNFGEPRRLSYKLVDGPDGWRVDDIGYAGGYGLRRDLLAAE